MYSKFSKVIASVLVATTLISTVMSDMVYASNIDDNSQIEYQLELEDETVVDIDAEPEEELNENETDVETVNSSTAVENIEEEDIVEDAVETAVYTINFYAGDEIIVSEEYEKNSVIEFPDMSNDETFLGWQIKVDDDNLEDVNTESEEYIVTSDVNFYAVFEEKNETELVETELKVEIDGYTVTATGNMPENAELSVIPVDEEETMEYDEKINETLSDDVVYKSYVAFDIDILVDGEKWQPVDFDELVKISIQSAQIEEKKEEVASGIISDFDEENEEVISYATVDDLEDTVYRIDTETEEIVEMLVDEENTDVDAVEFETEHFTIYSYGGTSYNTTNATTYTLGTGYTGYFWADSGLFIIAGSGTWSNSGVYSTSGMSDSTLKYGVKIAQFRCNEPTNTNYRLDGMFSGCTNLEEVTFYANSSFTFTGENALYTHAMFSGCTKLTKLILPDGFGKNSSNQFRLVENLKGLKTLYLPASIYTKYTSPNITGNSTTLFSSASQVRVTPKTGSSTVMTPAQAKTKMNTVQTVGYTYEVVTDPLFTFNSKSYYESDATATYTAGTNVKAYWYESDGVLGFVGSGAMNNWTMSSGVATTPWWDIREQVTASYVDPNITSLGAYMLVKTGVKNIYGLNTNTLITSIPNGMCSGCSSLTEVSFNNNIEKIGVSAFSQCTALTTFNFPSKLKTIENTAFSNDTSLVMTGITLPSNLESVGISVFNGCSKLALSGSLPTSLKTLNSHAFSGTKVTFTGDIPASMETIGSMVFPTTANFSTNKSGIAITYAMRVPTSYTITDTFTDGKKANVTTTKTGYVGATSASGTAPTYSGYTLKTNCTNTTITIGSTASDRLSLTRVYEPARVKIFTYNGKDYYNTDATATYKAGDNVTAYWYKTDGVLGFVGSGDMYNWNATSSTYTTPWYSLTNQIQAVYLSNGITSIGNYAFVNCTALENINDLPDSVTRIGDYAFRNAGTLNSTLELPLNLEYLGSYSFADCLSLNLVGSLPNKLKTISSQAFGISKNSKKVALTGSIPASVTSIGTKAFYGVDTLTHFDRNLSSVSITSSMYVPTSYTVVDTFNDGKKVDVTTTKYGYVGVTSSVGTAPTYTGYTLKTDCTDAAITIGSTDADRLNLTRVYEPARVKIFTCNGTDYYNTDAVETYIAGDNITAYLFNDGMLGFVGSGTMNNQTVSTTSSGKWISDAPWAWQKNTTNTPVRSAYFDSRITVLGNYALAYCNALEKIYGLSANTNITEIPEGMFRECKNLTSIDFPVNIKAIGQTAFQRCTALTMTGLSLPDSIEVIGKSAFYECSNLGIEGSLPANLKTIKSSAFYQCTNLALTGDIPKDVETWENPFFPANCVFDRNLSDINITSIQTTYTIVDTFTDGKNANVITTKKGYVGATSSAGTAPIYEGYKLKTDCVDATITIGKEHSDRLTLTRVYEPTIVSSFSVKLPASINVTGSNETMKHFGNFTIQAKGNKSKIMVTLPNAITLTGKNTTETFDLNVSKQNYIFKPILSAEDVNTDDTEYAELSSESYSAKSGKVSSNEDPMPDVYEGGLTVTITSED